MGPQWTNVLKTVWATPEWVVRDFLVFKEQCLMSLQTILKLVGIKVKFEASSTFLFQSV